MTQGAVSEPGWSYPWKEWTDGRMWRVEQGQGFSVEPEAFAKAVRAHARTRGLKASVVTGDGAACFQFHQADKPGEREIRLKALRQYLDQ
ncbi:hypothetical protein [Streptomyces erythrochromogenes]|uniref:hypothetical protein n=1 Tax=Streptomyces erythrochromogenes TaxID=285574 RepID=UPI0036FAE8FB